ncbi:MAG TPA: hypothetical protein VMG38_23310 [Trebonia sp.]|nr:hypothetical protein [Trebonia sp.]
MLVTLGRVVVGLVSAAVALAAVRSALRTIVVPRGVPDRLTRVVFLVLDVPTAWWAGRASCPAELDRRTAGLATRLLLALLVTWLGAIWLAGAGVQWALGSGSAGSAFGASASALTTLGVDSTGGGADAAAFIEAVIGVGLLALIIGYLPSFYAAFSRREALVTKLAVRTGLPPAGPAIVSRLWHPGGPQTLLGATWLEASATSARAARQSPSPSRTWPPPARSWRRPAFPSPTTSGSSTSASARIAGFTTTPCWACAPTFMLLRHRGHRTGWMPAARGRRSSTSGEEALTVSIPFPATRWPA